MLAEVVLDLLDMPVSQLGQSGLRAGLKISLQVQIYLTIEDVFHVFIASS